ncbi:MAG: hypothetical protein P4M11_14195 [Candidatus Pacebacteria bacterium]|nr:hypothetical protein [Candidatus Paceibacterota bacterium]
MYSTNEPQNVFYRRIRFCLGLHNEATRALEYPKKEEKSEKVPDKKEAMGVDEIADMMREEFD